MKTFRAWVDREGGNADRRVRTGNGPVVGARWAMVHRLVDVETDSYRIVLRLLWRLHQRPFYLEVQVWPTGRRGYTIFRWRRP